MTYMRARKIHIYLHGRADRLYDEECLMCSHTPLESQTRHAFDTPWDDEPKLKYFCSDACGDSYMYEEPYAYFWCNECNREVCEQNPMNGWHIQYRDYDDETVCLRCYEDLILENGVELEKIERGGIPGMFFSWGNSEPIEAGYHVVPRFKNYHVNSQERADEFRVRAMELIDRGMKVVIGYESLAYGGGEGYVTMMAKDGGS